MIKMRDDGVVDQGSNCGACCIPGVAKSLMRLMG